jgi:acyl-CoA synthetase (NDP forming)
MSLSRALRPRSIAVLGASDDPDKIGGRPLMFMKRFGFAGEIYPINPGRDQVQGLKSYPDLKALPSTPDLVMIAVPGEAAIAAVEACAAMGVAVVVVLSSGFGETSTPEGKRGEARMRDAARAAGMRLIGPNTQGLGNFSNGAIAGFSTMFIESPPEDGPVGIVSQSGAMCSVPYAVLRRRGIGVRYANSTGNDGDVTAAELAVEMARDEEIKLILVYLESISEPRWLIELGVISRKRRVPVIVLKGGSTDLGQLAARSHTGALANEDRTVDACLAAYGLWRAEDVTGLTAATELYLKGWRPAGRRIVVVSNSGASCVMGADAVSKNGLDMARLSRTTTDRLSEILPAFATVSNPIDITAALLTNSGLFGAILPVIGEDPAADAFVIAVPVAGQGYDVDAFARDAAAFARQTGKPVVIAAHQPDVAARFSAAGLPVFDFEAQAVAALAQFIKHHELLDTAADVLIPDRIEAEEVPLRTLSEVESFALLEAFDAPVAAYRVCTTAAACVDALRMFGGPVVIKGVSPDAPHKSELGLVKLGVVSAEQATAAFEHVSEALTSRGLANHGVLVARMVSGRRELIAGGRVDPVFGPVVVVGDGGKYVEALNDLQLLVKRPDLAAVQAAVDGLRIGPVLRGIRGDSPIDFVALTRVLAAVWDLLSDPSKGIESIDLNPVFVSPDGAVVADALIVRRSELRVEEPRQATRQLAY